MRTDKKKGFTFIELLVAISIFSVIAASLYSVFNTGVFAWRRLSVATDIYQQSRITLELMGNEIANYIPSQKVKLQGDTEKISFLGKVNNEGADRLKRISFFLEPSTNTLMRSQEGIESVLNKEEGENVVAEEFLSDVKKLEFKYFCKSSAPDKKDEYEWIDLLDPEGNSSCAAVSISIDAGVSFTKIVRLYANKLYCKFGSG